MNANKKVPEGLQSNQGTNEINQLIIPSTLDESQEVLYQLLTEATSDKPVCRYQYRLKTGMHERQFRQKIAELRNKGIRVVSDSHGRGYWIAKTEEEYISFRSQQMARVKSITDSIRAMDCNLLGQEVMDVLV